MVHIPFNHIQRLFSCPKVLVGVPWHFHKHLRTLLKSLILHYLQPLLSKHSLT